MSKYFLQHPQSLFTVESSGCKTCQNSNNGQWLSVTCCLLQCQSLGGLHKNVTDISELSLVRIVMYPEGYECKLSWTLEIVMLGGGGGVVQECNRQFWIVISLNYRHTYKLSLVRIVMYPEGYKYELLWTSELSSSIPFHTWSERSRFTLKSTSLFSADRTGRSKIIWIECRVYVQFCCLSEHFTTFIIP
jgi:hypothetical protein